MSTLQEILDIEFENRKTPFDNANFKQLILELDNLKDAINDSYDSEVGEFKNLTPISDCLNIMQEIHNRICANFDIAPTTVCVGYNDFLFNFANSIDGGKYSFSNRKIFVNILVNFKETEYNSYFFNYLNSAWTMYHLRNLFHETYHHIQMEMLKKYVYGNPLPERFENEIKMLEIYFDTALPFKNVITNYFLNPIEMPARKFARNSIDYLLKNGYLENNFTNNTNAIYNLYTEYAVCGQNNKNLEKSKYEYLFINYEEDKSEIIEKFYNEMNSYYNNINSKFINEILDIKDNLQGVDLFQSTANLSPLQLIGLNYDYTMYKQSNNKEEFINNIINSNKFLKEKQKDNLYSYLPSYKRNLDLFNLINQLEK